MRDYFMSTPIKPNSQGQNINSQLIELSDMAYAIATLFDATYVFDVYD